MSVPQFGVDEPGRPYPDRPAAFVVAERAGLIAAVRVDLSNGAHRIDLPGGGIDPGETAEQAAARECGEEAGLEIAIGALLVRADHFFVNQKNEACNTRGQFFVGQVVGDAPHLQIEPDHSLVWLEPVAALRAFSREAHAWALAAWLRKMKP